MDVLSVRPGLQISAVHSYNKRTTHTQSTANSISPTSQLLKEAKATKNQKHITRRQVPAL